MAWTLPTRLATLEWAWKPHEVAPTPWQPAVVVPAAGALLRCSTIPSRFIPASQLVPMPIPTLHFRPELDGMWYWLSAALLCSPGQEEGRGRGVEPAPADGEGPGKRDGRPDTWAAPASWVKPHASVVKDTTLTGRRLECMELVPGMTASWTPFLAEFSMKEVAEGTTGSGANPDQEQAESSATTQRGAAPYGTGPAWGEVAPLERLGGWGQ